MRYSSRSKVTVSLTLNGASVSADAEPRRLLSDFLRHDLGATGTHVGCEHGVCGVCTVMVDGAPVRSCLLFAVQADGAQVVTIEGLAADPRLDDLRAAFKRHHALQCGFCTPGILITLADWLDGEPEPVEARVRDVLSGTLCRCTGYVGIVEAALDVAEQRQRSRAEDTVVQRVGEQGDA